MPKTPKDIVAARPAEIVNACRKLYRKMTFQEITLKEISAETSFSRPSIYNYFHTKEEIFLALLEDEYRLWADDLDAILGSESHTAASFAEAIAESVGKRVLLIKILCMNLYEIEENSREERLIEFKKHYGRTIDLIDRSLRKFFPAIAQDKREEFIYELYPFLYGLYPYIYPTAKQRSAMEKAGMKPRESGIEELTEKLVRNILEALMEGNT